MKELAFGQFVLQRENATIIIRRKGSKQEFSEKQGRLPEKDISMLHQEERRITFQSYLIVISVTTFVTVLAVILGIFILPHDKEFNDFYPVMMAFMWILLVSLFSLVFIVTDWWHVFLYMDSINNLNTLTIYEQKKGRLKGKVVAVVSPVFQIDWKSNSNYYDGDAEPEWKLSLVENTEKKLFTISKEEDIKTFGPIKELIEFLDGYEITLTKKAEKRKEELLQLEKNRKSE
ncbi:MAG: hypothetical protein ACFFD4_13020 [Candidatus Odinarchaeota archaeon]